MKMMQFNRKRFPSSRDTRKLQSLKRNLWCSYNNIKTIFERKNCENKTKHFKYWGNTECFIFFVLFCFFSMAAKCYCMLSKKKQSVWSSTRCWLVCPHIHQSRWWIDETTRDAFVPHDASLSSQCWCVYMKLPFFSPQSERKHLQLFAPCTSDTSLCFPSSFLSFTLSILCSPIQHVCLCVISLRRSGPNFERHAVVPDERPLVICIIIRVVCSKLQINAADAKAAGRGATPPPVLWGERRHVLVRHGCRSHVSLGGTASSVWGVSLSFVAAPLRVNFTLHLLITPIPSSRLPGWAALN